MVPDIRNVPAGCAFHPRCGDVMERCSRAVPALMTPGDDPETRARCFLYGEATDEGRAR